MASAYLVLTTLPARDAALALGRTLVGEQLAACVNVLGEVQSIYRWKGQVQSDSEVLCVIKTTAKRFAALKARVIALHPYEVPELVAVQIAAGHAPYLAWLASAVATAPPAARGSRAARARRRKAG